MLDPLQHRRAKELLQPRQRQLHLRLDGARPRDAAPRSALRHVVEQNGLPDSGLAAEHQDRAPSLPHVLEQPVERIALGPPAPQQRALLARHAENHDRGPALSVKTGSSGCHEAQTGERARVFTGATRGQDEEASLQ